MNIVFDLDGTLVDSAPDLMIASNKMLRGEGLEPLDLATITSFVGNGLPKLVERVLRARGIATSQFERLYDEVRDFYNAAPADESKPMPGVMALLDKLKADGHRLGICTNKPEEPARLMLNLLGLEPYFDTVVGGDALPEKKPHPAPLNLAFERLGPGARLYVGDSEVDAEVALAAEVTFAIYAHGYRKQAIDGLPHDFRFDHFEELGPIIDTLPEAETAA
ncbi:phosphoglycolate phosphatase [Sinisalibacter aestuarii]|uniref:Phosphoglycolate phosphatase n=1 Tax=Sinisalibacter aestuarii TaxID=2949426 RepID=A0ABQ5LML0_9RHOB|nr:phosphoglycolate phosphatase [Sinisalibacter aestuarii]GKY86247.1 phosphoglycolate phosphatase [Sinisalibacter aestuarii]